MLRCVPVRYTSPVGKGRRVNAGHVPVTKIRVRLSRTHDVPGDRTRELKVNREVL
jgi:hypothetical protein